jgi:hypothetical protein
MASADKWVDRNAGPVVRPYALTGGRTEPTDGEVLDLITIVAAIDQPDLQDDDSIDLSPEDRAIVDLCRRPVTVADIASGTSLPLGVVRVLLADLIVQRRITVMPAKPAGEPSSDLLREVLHGLRAL